MANKTEIVKDAAAKKLNITRMFNAPLNKVWRAWTVQEVLDKWWAPRPWRAETKSLDFKTGGLWLYSMVSPEGERHWCRVDIKEVAHEQGFKSVANFCDENGTIDKDFPQMYWDVKFSQMNDSTRADIVISFDNDADMEKIIQMGFEGGFSMGLANLDEVLAAGI